jgi:DNA repair protein RadC
MARKPSAIKDAGDVYRLFRGLGKLKNERVYSVLLDGENNVLGSMEISRGGSCYVDVFPHFLFDSASAQQASSLIIVHNHTSGRPEPSLQDMEVTRRLYEDGLARGIDLADSVIIADGSYYSFREAGKMEGYKGKK